MRKRERDIDEKVFFEIHCREEKESGTICSHAGKQAVFEIGSGWHWHQRGDEKGRNRDIEEQRKCVLQVQNEMRKRHW